MKKTDTVVNKIKDWYENSIYAQEWFTLITIGIPAGTLLLSRNVLFSLLVLFLILVLSVVYELWEKMPRKEPEEEVVDITGADRGSVLLGYMGEESVTLPIESLNHVFIVGMTRYGKTRLVLSMVAEFLEKFEPHELKLAFSDAKAVSFNVFGRSSHLFAPIAKSQDATDNLINIINDEMYRRLNLFSEYHEKICTNLDEYYELSGERLPRIVVIFDEVADSVEPNSVAEKNLTSLAKMGLAAGIHLVLITQRPTKIGISHEITSQCQTIMSTYMKNPTEYGSVSKIPAKVYSQMVPEKGLFMVFSPDLAPKLTSINPDYEGWGFLKSRYLENNIIEGIAIVDSVEDLELPELEDSIPAWKGSIQDKLDAVEALDIRNGEVSIASMKKQFNIGHRTAKKFYNMYVEGKDV